MAPMMRELTARPTQPQVITKPMAVPVMRGKALPTMASVVGKTGAMERPAMKTSTTAMPGLLVRSMRNVVMAMAMDAARVTSIGGHMMQDRRDADAADEQAEREAEREDVESARLRNALGDEVARQPVPDAYFAGDVEKQEEAEQEEQRAAEDGARVGEDEAGVAAGRGHVCDGLNDERDHGERRDGIAEADPVLLKRLAEMNGVVRPPRPKKRLTRLSAVARCASLTPLTSALAPVTTMPPPMPSRNSRSTMLRGIPASAARGRARQR